MKRYRMLGLGVLFALAVGGCSDLEVLNPNAADRERALGTAGDIEGLLAGTYRNWWNTSHSTSAMGPAMANMSFLTSSSAGNFGMVDMSRIPREPLINSEGWTHFGQMQYPWVQLWRAVSSVVTATLAVDEGGISLGADDTRLRAWGNFVLGLAHGSAAMIYDRGYIYDPTIPSEEVAVHDYPAVLEAALGYLDEAARLSEGASFTIPEVWFSRSLTAEEVARAAHSFRARFRAAAARTPAERAAVDWDAVIADIDRGITSDFTMNIQGSDNGWSHSAVYNVHRLGSWGALSYFVLGMADQSGMYQEWISTQPVTERHPILDGTDFIFDTPDLRFPQGSTVEEQRADVAARTTDADQEGKGRLFYIPGNVGGEWNQPPRGTWRWSYYKSRGYPNGTTIRGDYKEIPIEEMNLLKAEALYRQGDLAGAAALVNISRTANGLNETDASGTNTSCVPKMADGSCGDLWEMLKWEKRLETIYQGHHMASWYFDGRGWGDLMEGTPLSVPVPEPELITLGIPSYTCGGPGGPCAAPVGTYG